MQLASHFIQRAEPVAEPANHTSATATATTSSSSPPSSSSSSSSSSSPSPSSTPRPKAGRARAAAEAEVSLSARRLKAEQRVDREAVLVVLYEEEVKYQAAKMEV